MQNHNFSCGLARCNVHTCEALAMSSATTHFTRKINNVNNLTTAMLEKSSMWTRPKFKPIRNFVETASCNPLIFLNNARA